MVFAKLDVIHFNFISWCSCRPRRPKCRVSIHHIVFTNASEVELPNLPSFHSTSSSFFKFLALLGRLLWLARRCNFAFPSKTCFDEWYSRSSTIDNGYCFSLKCLSRAAIKTLSCLAHNLGRISSSLRRKSSRVIFTVHPVCVPPYPKLCSFFRTTPSTHFTKTTYFCWCWYFFHHSAVLLLYHQWPA